MTRLTIAFACLLLMSTTQAQLSPPERTMRSVEDPSMVILDRGAKLEVLAGKRATTRADRLGRKVIHHVMNASATAAIGPHQLGVVFNHTLQQQGYITGEIAFKVTGQTFSADRSGYPGLKKLAPAGLYVVNARSPAEFIALMKRLQARSDLEWVEPVVTYGATDSAASIR